MHQWESSLWKEAWIFGLSSLLSLRHMDCPVCVSGQVEISEDIGWQYFCMACTLFEILHISAMSQLTIMSFFNNAWEQMWYWHAFICWSRSRSYITAEKMAVVLNERSFCHCHGGQSHASECCFIENPDDIKILIFILFEQDSLVPKNCQNGNVIRLLMLEEDSLKQKDCENGQVVRFVMLTDLLSMEWVSLMASLEHQTPICAIQCNHSLYIGIIIFPHTDNTQSTGWNNLRKNE